MRAAWPIALAAPQMKSIRHRHAHRGRRWCDYRRALIDAALHSDAAADSGTAAIGGRDEAGAVNRTTIGLGQSKSLSISSEAGRRQQQEQRASLRQARECWELNRSKIRQTVPP